jgi:hypothetical protein
MTSSAHLQHEADTARMGLSTALDELRSSVTTTALTNGAMTFAKEGSTAVARAAIDRAMASPLAALLIGAGVVMLLSSGKDSAEKGAVGNAIDKGNSAIRETASTLGSVGSTIAGAAASAFSATRHASGSVVDTAKGAAGKVASTASQAGHLATDTYGKAKEMVAKGEEQGAQTLADAQKLISETQTRLARFAEEQPILVAALGVAFGAALGASLPITEAERRYMGETSKALAGKGKEVATKVADSLTGTIAGQDIGGKVAEVADAVTSTVSQSLSTKKS